MANSETLQNYKVDRRWTSDLVQDGFTPVSIFFLENYTKLSPPITHSEAMLIIHLVRYKWTEDAPFPSFKTIADQMGISAQMARHHARSLQQKKYLVRQFQVGATNRFILTPLFAALSKLRAGNIAKMAKSAEQTATQSEEASAPAPPKPPSKKPPLPPGKIPFIWPPPTPQPPPPSSPPAPPLLKGKPLKPKVHKVSAR